MLFTCGGRSSALTCICQLPVRRPGRHAPEHSAPSFPFVNASFLGYLLSFGAATIACLGSAYRARQIADPDTRWGLVALLLTSAGWAGTYLGALLAPPSSLEYGFYLTGLVIGAATVGAWLWFCSAYTGRALHRDPTIQRAALLLFSIVAITKLTNSWHGLYFRTEPGQVPFSYLKVHYQALYWGSAGLAYALAAIGYFMLFDFFRTVGSRGGKLGTLAGLTALPLFFNGIDKIVPGLLDVSHEPLGVAAFAIGVTMLYRNQFQTVQIAGAQQVPTFVMGIDGTIEDYNQRAADLLPASIGTDAIGQSLQHVLPNVSEALNAGESIVRLDQGALQRYYQLGTSSVALEETRPCQVLLLSDVTDRLRERQTLARRKALLEAQAESTIDGLLAVDPDSHVVFYNRQFLDIWDAANGPPSGDLNGKHFDQVRRTLIDDLLQYSDEYAEQIEHLYKHPREENQSVLQLTDGRWIDWYSSPIVHDDTHFGRLWVFRDVTEQRRMQERLLEVQEEERRRIDQEIHDEMGGLMSSLQLTIDLTRRQLQEQDLPLEGFDQLETLVSDLSTATRQISRKLYPGALSEHGLAEVLPPLYDELETDYGLKVTAESEIDSGNRFSTLVERTVYWIVQEALINVSLHAETHEARVVINTDEERLSLHVIDEGLGFVRSDQDGEHSFGLEGIRRRVERLNGSFAIDSVPGEGTRLSAVLPHTRPFPSPPSPSNHAASPENGTN